VAIPSAAMPTVIKLSDFTLNVKKLTVVITSVRCLVLLCVLILSMAMLSVVILSAVVCLNT